MTDNGKPDVFASINAVMRDVQAVRKGEKNTHGNFLFRGIEQTVATKGGLTCGNSVESKQPPGVLDTLAEGLTTHLWMEGGGSHEHTQ